MAKLLTMKYLSIGRPWLQLHHGRNKFLFFNINLLINILCTFVRSRWYEFIASSCAFIYSLVRNYFIKHYSLSGWNICVYCSSTFFRTNYLILIMYSVSDHSVWISLRRVLSMAIHQILLSNIDFVMLSFKCLY